MVRVACVIIALFLYLGLALLVFVSGVCSFRGLLGLMLLLACARLLFAPSPVPFVRKFWPGLLGVVAGIVASFFLPPPGRDALFEVAPIMLVILPCHLIGLLAGRYLFGIWKRRDRG